MTARRIHETLNPWIVSSADETAVIDHDHRQYSFQELSEKTDSVARYLQSEGVRPGDRVMLVAENSLALVATVLACSRLDAWVIPVNARLTETELSRIREHATPRIQVFTNKASASADRHASEAGADDLGTNDLDGIRATRCVDSIQEDVFESAADQVALLIYTTGTTGAPKGVMVTHGNTLFNMGVNQDIRNISNTDHVYPAPPHTHIFGLTAVLAALGAGARVTLLPRFEPPGVFEALSAGVTIMPAVPAMYNRLIQYAESQGWSQPDAPNLRYISAGGAPLDLTWKQKVEAFFGLTLNNGYGLTEAAPIVTATRFDECWQDTSVGKPPPGVELKIDRSRYRDSVLTDVGEVCCRGPNVMKGYYLDPHQTRATIDSQGYLHTGDLGRLADDGSLTLVGRLKEVIIHSGFNIYPEEVEEALNRHPGVVESAVVGRKRKDGNEEILAFVECRPEESVSAEELKSFLMNHLTGYKRPRDVFIVAALPRAPTGKILKSKILDSFNFLWVDSD